MAGEALVVTQHAAAAAMFALAAWLLRLRFSSPVNRSFALFLVLRGAVTLANRLEDATRGTPGADYWERIGAYFELGLVPTLAYFALAYRPPRALSPRALRLARWSVIGAGVLVEALHLAAPCVHQCAGAGGRAALGPLSVLVFATPLAYGLLGLWLAREAAAAAPGARRMAAFLVSVAFALNALVDGGIGLAILARFGVAQYLSFFAPSPWAVVSIAAYAIAAAPAALALAVLARAALPGTRRALALAPLALASGAFVGLSLPLPEALANLGLFVLGAWRILLPALVAYALVRHRLFDLDLKIRWSINRGTVAAAFLGVFIVVANVAENYLDARLGVVTGGVAASVLVLALNPLQRLGERLATAVVPPERPPGELSPDERLDIYRDQLVVAWADGALNRRERLMLDRLRERLGIEASLAARVEREALEASVADERANPTPAEPVR